jgi:hypothetical protein
MNAVLHFFFPGSPLRLILSRSSSADSNERPSVLARSNSVGTSSPRNALARMDCVTLSTRFRPSSNRPSIRLANGVENRRETLASQEAVDALQSSAAETKRRGRFQQGRVWDSTIRLAAILRYPVSSNTCGGFVAAGLLRAETFGRRHRSAGPVNSKLASRRQRNRYRCNARIVAWLGFSIFCEILAGQGRQARVRLLAASNVSGLGPELHRLGKEK